MAYLQEQINNIDWVEFGINLSMILSIVASIVIWFHHNVAKFAALKAQASDSEALLVHIKAILKSDSNLKAVIKKSNSDVLIEVGALKMELRELRKAIHLLIKEKEE